MIHGIESGAPPGVAPSANRRRAVDPLARTIAWDLVATIGGFLMIVAAVVLTVQGFSVGG